jgi:hypothetical protein
VRRKCAHATLVRRNFTDRVVRAHGGSRTVVGEHIDRSLVPAIRLGRIDADSDLDRS